MPWSSSGLVESRTKVGNCRATPIAVGTRSTNSWSRSVEVLTGWTPCGHCGVRIVTCSARAVGHPQPPRARAPVSCQLGPVCHVQGGMMTERKPVFAAVPRRGCVVVTACAAKSTGARTPTEGHLHDARCGLAPLSLRPPTPVRPWHTPASMARTRPVRNRNVVIRDRLHVDVKFSDASFVDHQACRPLSLGHPWRWESVSPYRSRDTFPSLLVAAASGPTGQLQVYYKRSSTHVVSPAHRSGTHCVHATGLPGLAHPLH